MASLLILRSSIPCVLFVLSSHRLTALTFDHKDRNSYPLSEYCRYHTEEITLSDSSISDKYLAIPIQKFRDATRDINFDVFLKLSEDNFAHVFSRSTGLDYRRLAQYTQKGVRFLYIKREDETSFHKFIEKTAHELFNDPGTSNEKKVAVLLNMTEQNISELFSQMEIPKHTAESTKKVVSNYVNLMGENPKTLTILLKLVSHGEYLYYHAIAVAVFSMFLAKATGQFNRRMIEIIGLGGFYMMWVALNFQKM